MCGTGSMRPLSSRSPKTPNTSVANVIPNRRWQKARASRFTGMPCHAAHPNTPQESRAELRVQWGGALESRVFHCADGDEPTSRLLCRGWSRFIRMKSMGEVDMYVFKWHFGFRVSQSRSRPCPSRRRRWLREGSTGGGTGPMLFYHTSTSTCVGLAMCFPSRVRTGE